MRLKLRTLLILVAVAALATLWARQSLDMKRRARDYESTALRHEVMGMVIGGEADLATDAAEIAKLRKQEQWHAQQQRRYKEAAAHPWKSLFSRDL